MKKHFLLVATFALLFSISANAQLFWKISGNGLEKTSYLFGTHHLINKDQIKNFDQILTISGQVDAVVGEIDMSDMQTQAVKMMSDVMMKDTTMKDLLSAEDYFFVDSVFQITMNTGLDKLGTMKPAMLSAFYVISSYMKENGTNAPPTGVDELFQKKAKEQNKKILPLETIDEQMFMLFGSMSLKRQAEVLVKDLKDIQKSKEDMKNLNSYYLAGDLVGIESLSNMSCNWTPEEVKVLIDNRNLNWAKKLPTMLKEQSCFIAVGAMHLVGETGLIKQLKVAGYKVEPVVL